MIAFIVPSKTTVCIPPEINAEPINPPINAWLLEEGNPIYHVIKFHTIAPTRPANITSVVANSGFIIPFPIVEATAVPKIKGPMKLVIELIVTACNGFNILLPTTVAIAFAAS